MHSPSLHTTLHKSASLPEACRKARYCLKLVVCLQVSDKFYFLKKWQDKKECESRESGDMIGTYATYRNVINTMEKTTKAVMNQPVAKRETDYYTKNITSVRSVDEFMGNARLYNYAVKAWGIEEMGFAKGMIRKVLTDPTFAGGLIDKRYREFAQAFNFNKYGDKATSQPLATKATVNKYMQQTLEVDIGQKSKGARLALYFIRTIGSMVQGDALSKDGWAYQMVSDKALREVVFTALSIPDNVGAADVEGQKHLIESRMSYEDLADPKRLEKFIGRFSALYDAKHSTPDSAALTLMQSVSAPVRGTFSNDAMMAVQSLKLGAR